MTPEPSQSTEEERIRSAYARYESEARSHRWDPTHPANRLMHVERVGVLKALVRSDGVDVATVRVLDVGCGSGGSMADWLGLGVPSHRVMGVDMLLGRMTVGTSDAMRMMVNASGAFLPFRDATFGVVSLFTVLSSILEDALLRRVAAEVQRVLSPRGRIYCYDMRYPNPLNPDVRRLSLAHLKELFPRGRFETRTLTVVPQLVRRLRLSGPAYERCSSVRMLHSHRMTSISFLDASL